jgi:hypothetical protein
MKKTISVLIAFLLMVNYSCKEKIDVEKEKEAILAVMEEEKDSYWASDFERWSATYLQDSTAMRMGSSRNGFSLISGWDSISSNIKPDVVRKKEVPKEVKTPIRIKIYKESAWVVYDTERFNNKGESVLKQIETFFYEKHDGKWKIILRDLAGVTSYYQADINLINSINYAKSLGKSVEDLASFTGDQFKTSWNIASGFNGFVNGILSNWRPIVPMGELKIQERDDNHIIFSASKMFTGLKTGPQYNVTYDDYLTFYRVACEKIADYMGAIYKQETTQDGILVTISKK